MQSKHLPLYDANCMALCQNMWPLCLNALFQNVYIMNETVNGFYVCKYICSNTKSHIYQTMIKNLGFHFSLTHITSKQDEHGKQHQQQFSSAVITYLFFTQFAIATPLKMHLFNHSSPGTALFWLESWRIWSLSLKHWAWDGNMPWALDPIPGTLWSLYLGCPRIYHWDNLENIPRSLGASWENILDPGPWSLSLVYLGSPSLKNLRTYPWNILEPITGTTWRISLNHWLKGETSLTLDPEAHPWN